MWHPLADPVPSRLSRLTGKSLYYAAHHTVGPLCQKGTALAYVQLTVHNSPHVLLCRAEMGHPQKCCAGDLQAEGGQCLYHWRCHCGMQGRARVLKGVRALQKNIVQGTVEMCEAHPRMPGGRPKGGRMGWVHLDGEGSSMERAKENHGLKGNFMLERMSGGPQ